MCYVRENPESFAKQKELYDAFKKLPKNEQKALLRKGVREYTVSA